MGSTNSIRQLAVEQLNEAQRLEILWTAFLTLKLKDHKLACSKTAKIAQFINSANAV